MAPGETAAITINSDAYIYKETFRTGLDLFTLFKTELKLTWQQKKKTDTAGRDGSCDAVSARVCLCAHPRSKTRRWFQPWLHVVG